MELDMEVINRRDLRKRIRMKLHKVVNNEFSSINGDGRMLETI